MKGTTPILALALAFAVTGCATVPKADVDAAEKALNDARAAKAPEYAADAWNAAQDAEAKLQAELEAQQKTWALGRSYQTARTLAATAKDQADKAAQAAIAGKDAAKADATALMSQAREEAKKASDMLQTAPRGKGTEADLASLKFDSTAIGTTLDEMQKAFDSEDYMAAKSKAQAAIDAAKQIQNEVGQAKSRRRAA